MYMYFEKLNLWKYQWYNIQESMHTHTPKEDPETPKILCRVIGTGSGVFDGTFFCFWSENRWNQSAKWMFKVRELLIT